ncbi:MAG: sigma-54-dependent transcriptional regulator [Myxococcota bacterium]
MYKALNTKYSILYVDDEPDNLDVFRFNFRGVFEIFTASSGEEALAIVKNNDIAVIITDQRMPRMTGLQFLEKAYSTNDSFLGIILTAYKDTDVLIEAIKAGYVFRFITKPWDSEELRNAIAQALELYHLRLENKFLHERLKQYAGYLDNQVKKEFNFGNIVGQSNQLNEVLQKIKKVASTSSTVLIRGETGTGKELIAHAIHHNSKRSKQPFVKINCAALSPGVLESELFGHEKGAFTGAVNSRMGRFELADNGTIFLDEIGDLPLKIQVKLLRILQEMEFERVGGEKTLKVDVRVVSATHKNLEELVKAGKFRQDLYYRLNVFPIMVPPLRQRKDDLLPLLNYFIEKYAKTTGKVIKNIETGFLDTLEKYSWPGNVRELENLTERAIILSSDGVLKKENLEFGPVFTQNFSTQVSTNESRNKSLKNQLAQQEKERIVEAVKQNDGNMAAAARSLEINRSTLYYRIKKYNLDYLV